MTTHMLKTWPVFFEALRTGDKNFEVRRKDRVPTFAPGDLLILHEWNPVGAYTGRSLVRRVTRVEDLTEIGIPGFVVLSLAEVR